jgi:hypothetical protein
LKREYNINYQKKTKLGKKKTSPSLCKKINNLILNNSKILLKKMTVGAQNKKHFERKFSNIFSNSRPIEQSE